MHINCLLDMDWSKIHTQAHREKARRGSGLPWDPRVKSGHVHDEEVTEQSQRGHSCTLIIAADGISSFLS